MDKYTQILKYQTVKKKNDTTTANAGEDMGQQELSFIVGGNENCTSA